MPAIKLARLLAQVAAEPSPHHALDALVHGALEVMNARHVLLARLNVEGGYLETAFRAGVAPDDAPPRPRMPVSRGNTNIVGSVVATGQPLSSRDVAADYQPLFPSTRAEVAVPIRDVHDRLRAVLHIESDEPDAFGPLAADLAEALAALAGTVLAREAASRREEALSQIASALDAVRSEEALVDRVIGVAEEVLDFQACSIFLLDERSDRFVLRGTTGILRPSIGLLSYARSEGFTGWVCDHGEPILLDNPQGDARWRGKFVEIPSVEIASFLAVPIVKRGRGLGAIRVLRRKTDNPYLDNRFTTDDLRLMQAVADQFATGLENLRLVESTIRSERMVAWGELSAKSSHMIGNRVFALKGDVNELGHLLTEESLELPLLQGLHRDLRANLVRIEEILQDFRDFVTATQLDRQPGDLNALVRETVEEVFPKRTEVTLDLRLGDVPPIRFDGKKLRRAISELVENAFHYMSTGTLCVETGRDPSSGQARIEIQDSGPGVPEDEKGRIFQPFFSGRVKGMGLGLSIVKGIVDSHGGEVQECGAPGDGAKFVILLPVEA